MTQSGVSAFVRLARRFAMSAVLLFASAGALAAQTGKLEGKVRDQAGAPIQSAQVFIVGTAFSALTNAQGYYFINNIPAGTMSVRGAFIGYKKTEIEGVKILAGQTITQDIQLEKATVVIDSLVVTTATNPLVPRDAVTTKQTADGAILAEPAGRPGRPDPGAAAGRCGREQRHAALDPRRPYGRSGVLRRRRQHAAGQPRQRLRRRRSDGVQCRERRRRPEQQRRHDGQQRLRGSLGDDGCRGGAVRQCAGRYRQHHVAHRWQQVRRSARGGVRRDVRLDDRHGLQPVRGQPQRPAHPEWADLRGQRGRRGQRVGPVGQGPPGRPGVRHVGRRHHGVERERRRHLLGRERQPVLDLHG